MEFIFYLKIKILWVTNIKGKYLKILYNLVIHKILEMVI